MKKVICVIGPTAVGKTKIGVELAKRLNTEVISGDSVQVYKGLVLLKLLMKKKTVFCII